MRSWVPRWWRGEAGLVGSVVSTVTLPAELAFRGVAGVRNALYEWGLIPSRRSPLPVVSIGNVSVGGTGKTPMCAWVAARLADLGRVPAVILRGYGEDEIAVHRELNPRIEVFAARRRIEAVRAAAASGADCVVLDDGFQHRALRRDLDIVLIAADSWSRARRLLPRGPWREPLGSLRRADIVLVTRKNVEPDAARRVAEELRRQGVEAPVGTVHLRAARAVPLHGDGPPVPLGSLAGRRIVAITSLGDPRPFVACLQRTGAEVLSLAFPDHHDFTDDDLARIQKGMEGRTAVMTLKEAVKLRVRLANAARGLVVEQEVEIESGGAELEAGLRRAIGGSG